MENQEKIKRKKIRTHGENKGIISRKGDDSFVVLPHSAVYSLCMHCLLYNFMQICLKVNPALQIESVTSHAAR